MAEPKEFSFMTKAPHTKKHYPCFFIVRDGIYRAVGHVVKARNIDQKTWDLLVSSLGPMINRSRR